MDLNASSTVDQTLIVGDANTYANVRKLKITKIQDRFQAGAVERLETVLVCSVAFCSVSADIGNSGMGWLTEKM
ncbi:hypothetical protein A2U01_0027304 [Trifolium medium]|uniref:Uncharacterized protein n=1 Tax=Trifolium medium TaxID=97028 RepID=A0A392P4M7_9FABA|nr:hypothetical protein [Trifolium medium]